MKSKGFAACAAVAMLGVVGVGVNGASADETSTTPVLKTELSGVEGTEANIVLFDVAAGWETQRHIHPGHVFVYVTEGSIQVDVDGEEPRTFAAGEAFYELPDKPMVARTTSADEGARFIVFQVGPTGEPIMVPHPQ
ncbi:cupin domain-containing protein [Nitratireductor luteus]|uniref:cupin domain-containing protein n=1 Tax=Nitratireductor luteus TaxID=2976980 RepID=UPI002240360B|nr:cupin domain-containing protein [Nitratireductor luteus]